MNTLAALAYALSVPIAFLVVVRVDAEEIAAQGVWRDHVLAALLWPLTVAAALLVYFLVGAGNVLTAAWQVIDRGARAYARAFLPRPREPGYRDRADQ